MTYRANSFKEFYFKGVSSSQWSDYRWHLQNLIRNINKVSSFLKIDPEEYTKLLKNEKKLNISITPHFLSLINPEDMEDPLRKQCVPSSLEFSSEEGSQDPLGEKLKTPVKGVIHKYPDRVLFLVTNKCPLYCRHCFRRSYWNNRETKTKFRFKEMVDYVKKNTSVKEVIISGGDPLLLEDNFLDSLLKELRKIHTVEIIRIASRVLSVLPQRITKDFVSILKKYSPLWFISHFNHPNEISNETISAVEKLLSSKVILLNQTVLLKGVNDESLIVETLFRKLLKIGIKPYYLFQCDPAKGISHFRTPLSKGLEIMQHLNGRVSGLAQPIFAIDTYGGGKIPLSVNYIVSVRKNLFFVKNFEGKVLKYKCESGNVKKK